MSLNLKYEKYKVKREIKRCGRCYDVYRPKINEFGEPTNELEVVMSINCLYHEYAPHTLDTFVTLTGQSTGVTELYKKTPQLFCLYDEIFYADREGQKPYQHIKLGDRFYFNGIEAKVSGLRNYQQLDIAWDISLEVTNDGTA